MQTQLIDINKLKLNRGQIPGVPKNPRFIKDKRFEKLKKSISDDPEMLELRELIAYPYNDELIVIMGSQRLRACKELGFKEVNVKILDVNTPVEKIKAYIIKDNVLFGEDDNNLLAMEWQIEELKDFGMNFKFDVGFEEEEKKTEKKKKIKYCPHCKKEI